MDVREKLVELLSEYFDIGDSYAYNLTRVKSAFACGTMRLDDFVEFDDEVVADIADHLIANGVTVQDVPDNNVGKWISVKNRLPEDSTEVSLYMRSGIISTGFYDKHTKSWVQYYSGGAICVDVTHWQPMPRPPKGD